MAKKSNVFLKTSYNYHAGEVKPCGYLQIGEMSEFFAQIKNAKIPSESCIAAIYTSIASTALTMRGKNTQNNAEKFIAEEFIIDIYPTNQQCKIKNKANCPKCIAAGKCRDEFVIDLIGKKLFADKYTNEK